MVVMPTQYRQARLCIVGRCDRASARSDRGLPGRSTRPCRGGARPRGGRRRPLVHHDACVAVERGITVLPYRWRDEAPQTYAAERAAVARGRPARGPGGRPARRQPVAGGDGATCTGSAGMVLPSPNGSSIAFALAERGATVVGACLRNRGAVARWLHRACGGERSPSWPPASAGPTARSARRSRTSGVPARSWPPSTSPTRRRGAHGRRRVPCRRATLAAALAACASGRELVTPASPRTSRWPPSWTSRTSYRCSTAGSSGRSPTKVGA